MDAFDSSGQSPGVVEEFGRFLGQTGDRSEADRWILRANHVAAAAMTSDEVDAATRRFKWAKFDYDSAPAAPRFVVDRLLERQTVNLVSGDTGVAKSFLMMGLAVAATTGAAWLGRTVFGQRAMYIDEENPRDVGHERLRALGMTNDCRERLRYSNRVGARIGAGNEWATELRREVEEFRPDLIVIDTALAALDVEVNENDMVAALYTETLRPLASDFDCAVVIVHHERKGQTGGTNGGMDAMGARSWAGQADCHLTLKLDEGVSEEAAGPGRLLRSTFTMRLAKSRRGQGFPAETVALTSKKDDADALLWAKVTSEGTAEDDRRTLAREIVATVGDAEGPMRRVDIANHVGRESNNGTFGRALKDAVTRQWIEKEGPRYRLAAAGGLAI